MPYKSTADVDQLELRRLGEHLRELREQSDMSQDKLANAAGLHRTYVGAVERGERNPTYLTLRKYSVGLDLTVADIVAGLN